MECCKCHTQMKRKAIDGVLVDSCPTCEGIWLDDGELEMLRDHEGKGIEELCVEARAEAVVDKNRIVTTRGMCPRCQATGLTPKITGGVALDICPGCKGIYFDWGELGKVLQSASFEGFGAFIGKIRKKLYLN